jgi:hypothetical protein
VETAVFLFTLLWPDKKESPLNPLTSPQDSSEQGGVPVAIHVEQFKRVPLFAKIPDVQLERMGDGVRERCFEPGAAIVARVRISREFTTPTRDRHGPA